ncbi:tyrosine-type recombinase/integrase [Hafnia alvei]|uniref:phage integrase n=1 Tax=Hafnia alvei TaxID=569 RepID=UPI000B64079C|nr:tyrosine-type recombinase/integrase [Hafnia alvei]MBI0278505.1 tyrosine-type recombinase/integrase [Hafnia alvei]PNK97583.1 integrase [Hafnia alvei]
MGIKSLGADGYMVDIRPQGRDGKRIRKKFPTKAEAQQYARWAIATQNNKDWLEKPADRRPFSELIELWWKYYGQSMKSARGSLLRLERIDRELGTPKASQITVSKWADYRAARLSAGVSASTINREQETISSLFNVLIDLGHFHNENPFSGLTKIKVRSREMGFLSKGEINDLLATLSGENLLAVKVCLATGARWGEVVKMRQSAVYKQRITFVDTKNGKNRTVPTSTVLFDELKEMGRGLVFSDIQYPVIRAALKEIAPDLPSGQAVHVLRHTFASHFMMNGGNILALQKILGHANIQQTMTYAHFAPDYLLDAVKFNPLAT